MGKATIRAIEYYLPEYSLTNEVLVRDFPDWTAEKIEAKTGIRSRRIAASDELASDLAVKAAERLFVSGACNREEIEYVLLCTESPDYLLPPSACLVQDRLGIPTSAGALDFSLGCSGFVYGLSLAKGIVETGQAEKVLLITAETYSKHLDEKDVSVRAVFGDGAAATLVDRDDAPEKATEWLGPFVFGTDGRGATRLILRRGSLRESSQQAVSGGSPLYMNGPDIFAFTLKEVPAAVKMLLDKAGLDISDVSLFVFHQANKFMLEHLRNKLHIPAEKFVYALEDCGNTVSSTIPIALRSANDKRQLSRGDLVMLVGFGVGYSWAGAMVRWGGLLA